MFEKRPYVWQLYSRRLRAAIIKPHCCGTFGKREGANLLLVTAREGSASQGNTAFLQLLLDTEDGQVLDAKFSACGHSALIGALEGACQLAIGKNYDMVSRIRAEEIDLFFRDKPKLSAFPDECAAHLNVAIDCLDSCTKQCSHLPLPVSYVAPVAPSSGLPSIAGDGFPGYMELTRPQKLKLIQDVLAADVLPYIALDGGGIDVIDLHKDIQLLIAYKGSCVGCHSSTGATLGYIQQVMKAKIHPDLVVIPQI